MQILKTSDLSIFKKNNKNRKIDPVNLNKIKNSIQSRNLLEMRPILVDKEMMVIDGQHRLEAARILGLEVFYQIDPQSDILDMILLNANQSGWTKDDYCNYYENSGNENYMKLRRLSMETTIPVTQLTLLLKGDGGSRKAKEFRNGHFRFPDQEKIDDLIKTLEKAKNLLEFMQSISLTKSPFLYSRRLASAVHLFVKRQDIDFELLKKKISYKFDSLRACVSSESYYELLKQIYNYRNPDPI